MSSFFFTFFIGSFSRNFNFRCGIVSFFYSPIPESSFLHICAPFYANIVPLKKFVFFQKKFLTWNGILRIIIKENAMFQL
ncbi:hypothetical protein AMJ44_09950 [candidate division WOR-1 bacterium DG_54_3]|uniref:Uncharacterized protein n=1 Tax=candidate division WOR-1 bacterium DG_54_3 TaxID=1703775 RepID=A0A0S7XSU9_UNCSA|nr:MAG: hypothetical protein AMJ44_09950 [candidate division WOR-1 bacterium DG_54_3]